VRRTGTSGACAKRSGANDGGPKRERTGKPVVRRCQRGIGSEHGAEGVGERWRGSSGLARIQRRLWNQWCAVASGGLGVSTGRREWVNNGEEAVGSHAFRGDFGTSGAPLPAGDWE
jgi:hypothetical protein